MFDQIAKDPEALGQVLGAVIGVVGLFVGTFITIFTSFLVRHMDIRREERKEEALLERAKKEKEFNLKQEIYSEFISELASLENFITKKSSNNNLKTIENFDNEWTRIEIKMELVSNENVKNLKNNLSSELMELAEKRFAQKDSKEIALSENYMQDRTSLLEAIREDMEISTI
ncbi:hypothetical protein IT411_02575 [Candidatus Peregrinibacteria bacterium]|nr:hypothetical protein [Candidatus Peregrinibacteria bacterium]